MDESGEKFANLAPMRIRHDSVQSNVADFLQHQANKSKDRRRFIEIDGTISGIDVGEQLGASSGSDRDIGTAETDYNEALGRFMRNEIAYDEFMEITGGVGLNEEAADFDDSMVDDDLDETDLPAGSSRVNRHRDSTSANEAFDDEEMDEDDEGGPSTSGLSSIMRPLGSVPALASSRGFKSERIFLTNKNGEEIDEDRLLGIPLELRNSGPSADQLAGRSIIVKSGTFGMQQRNKLSKTLDALLGQANVIYAKGQTKEALTMLLEVIRQEPRSPDAYRLVADIYKEMNQPHKSLQYGLLAAHLNSRTPAEEWVELGNLAHKLQRIEEAAACYGRAIRAEPSNWKHYEKRIETLDLIGLRPVAMRTRLMAAQNIDHSSAQVDFDWFQALIKTVAEYYIQMNDEEKAILALEAFVLRSREFGRKADSQHQTLVGMWMARQRFEDAAKSIFALCQGITALDADGKFAMEIKFNNAGYTVTPFPPRKVHRFVVGNSFSSMLLIRLIVCFIRLGRKDLVPTLVDKLFERDILPEDEPLYVDIARAYQAVECIPHAQKYVEHLLARHCFSESPDVWFLYGQLLSARKKTEEATRAYERVLDIQPSHVDARINLSTLQQRLGMAEKAFETLRDYDLDAGSSLPDERLLIRQADFLSQHKRTDQFVRCVRMLLTPHFYVVHQNSSLLKKRAISGSGKTVVALCNGLRAAAFNAVHGSPLEKYVKRLGAIAASEDRPPSDMTATQLHDYTFKLLEILLSQGRYADALHVCCYSYLQPLICKSHKTVETFHNLLMFCAMKAHYWPLAFEYLRWFHTSTLNNNSLLVPAERDLLFTRIFNAMNHVFCHSQNVSYHRYVMRALARMPGNIALQMISGNNSLITGAYRHALGEYLRVWFQVPDNPLVCLLLALTFTHMACKKDISSRHMVALRGLAFMNRYQRLRGDCQETNFNIARMFHQMNILPLAIHFYQKCLDSKVPMVAVVDEDTGEETIVPYERYDLRPSAAHNLAIIYETSGNVLLARQLLLKYCTIERMSVPCEHEWELNRENIRPLRGGRSVHAINTVFGGVKVSMKEAEAKFESDLKEAEESSDPIEKCVRYVAWFEEHFPTGKQSHLYPMLTRIINKFGYREEYLNDERMLKMWFKLAENRGNASPEALFERAFTAGCCRRMAKFYIRWAEMREDMRDIEGARAIFNRARENRAEPLSVLNQAVDDFEMRQLRALTEVDTASDEDADVAPNEPVRIALGGLTGLGRNLRTPVVRSAVMVADGLRSGAKQQAQFAVFADGATSSTSANAFSVFEGGEEFNEQNALIPQDFGEDLARVEFAENTREPAKWKQSRIDSIKKTKNVPAAAFDVFDEMEYKKKKKERREREKAKSCLLIRDEVISSEELLALDIGELPVDVSADRPTHLTAD